MDLSLILDAIVAVLLITTIGYAVVLNRRLGALRNAKSEIEALVAQFAESTDKAGRGIESLKDETKRSGEALQGKLNAARGLVDDLASSKGGAAWPTVWTALSVRRGQKTRPVVHPCVPWTRGIRSGRVL